VVDIKQG